MSKPTIVVFGATGQQGSSVVQHLKKSNKYHIKGVSRQDIKDKDGIEWIKADLENPRDLDEALKGAYGVYGITNFWGFKPDEDRFLSEQRHGMNLVDACKRQAVKHLVWSTLDKCNVPHFESKARVSEHCEAIGVPTTHLYTGWFLTNLYKPRLGINKQGDKLVWSCPMDGNKTLPAFDPRDIGAWAAWAFDHPERSIGQHLKVVSEFISPNEIAEIGSKLTGKEFIFKTQTENVLEELRLNYKYFEEHPNCRDLKWSREIYPEAKTWKDVAVEFISKVN